MKRPSQLPRGCEFFLFKKDIKPLWEDENNKDGGRFIISLKKTPVANKIWEDLLIGLLLTDDELKEINGVVLNVRASEVFLSLWTKKIDQEKEQMIKQWIKE